MVALMALGAPSLARADQDKSGEHGNRDDRDRSGDHGEHHGDAPEPLTVIGLALGVGAIAVGRWAVGRKSTRKR